MLPYSRQSIDPSDIRAVVEVLQSDWLTTGPMVQRFEEAFAQYVATRQAVAFSNGTAALHAAMSALCLQPGDEVIVPAITFVATANAVIYAGGIPIFADISPDTLLMDSRDVVRKITSRTRALVAVDYAGQTCDYAELKRIARQNDLKLIADCCHSIGARSYGRHVPEWVDAACYSFHPVKPMTTCEGGMVATDDLELAAELKVFRNHGIATDHHQRSQSGTCFYDMQALGYNYRLSDVHCALGLSQLQRLPAWTMQRARIAEAYGQQFQRVPYVRPLTTIAGAGHAHHLYVVRWSCESSGVSRDDVLGGLRDQGIQANVHYRPVYQHSYYQKNFSRLRMFSCPQAELAYPELISLPIFPAMTPDDVNHVVDSVRRIVETAQPTSRRSVA